MEEERYKSRCICFLEAGLCYCEAHYNYVYHEKNSEDQGGGTSSDKT